MADQNVNNQTVTWNSGGTTFNAIKMNVTDTASAAASLLLLLQVGGSDKFKVGKDGTITGAGGLSIAGSATISGNLTVTGTLTAAGIVGTVTGPVGATDNAVARFNGTTGGVLQNSAVTIDDGGSLSTAANLSAGGIVTSGFVFQSSSASVALATTGAGTISLRPNGFGSGAGQVTVASTGAVTINGTLTVTG